MSGSTVKNKVCILTDATGGIGAATARCFAAGSVARYVAAHAALPVLVVPSDAVA